MRILAFVVTCGVTLCIWHKLSGSHIFSFVKWTYWSYLKVLFWMRWINEMNEIGLHRPICCKHIAWYSTNIANCPSLRWRKHNSGRSLGKFPNGACYVLVELCNTFFYFLRELMGLTSYDDCPICPVLEGIHVLWDSQKFRAHKSPTKDQRRTG